MTTKGILKSPEILNNQPVISILPQLPPHNPEINRRHALIIINSHLPNPIRSLIFLNNFNFRCPVCCCWCCGATKRFSLLHWQDIAPILDRPPTLLLWQDVERVDCEPEDTEVLPLPPNLSTLDKPISRFICNFLVGHCLL